MPGGEVAERRGLNRWDGVDVELIEALEPWEPGVADAANATAFAAVVDFGGEDIGQVGEIGLAFAARNLGELGCFVIGSASRSTNSPTALTAAESTKQFS